MGSKIEARITGAKKWILWLEKQDKKDRKEIAKIAAETGCCDNAAIDRIERIVKAIRAREEERARAELVIEELEALIE